MGENIFVMLNIGRSKLVLEIDFDVVRSFGNMHACFVTKLFIHFILFFKGFMFRGLTLKGFRV
jgi:hypothetical protein